MDGWVGYLLQTFGLPHADFFVEEKTFGEEGVLERPPWFLGDLFWEGGWVSGWVGGVWEDRGERGGSNELLWVWSGWVGGWVGGWVVLYLNVLEVGAALEAVGWVGGWVS